jgi:hypothetical protein
MAYARRSLMRIAAHLSGKDDNLVKVDPILDCYGDYAAFLGDSSYDEAEFKRLRQSETTGRPLGREAWLEKLENMTGKTLKPQKRGPMSQDRDGNQAGNQRTDHCWPPGFLSPSRRSRPPLYDNLSI